MADRKGNTVLTDEQWRSFIMEIQGPQVSDKQAAAVPEQVTVAPCKTHQSQPKRNYASAVVVVKRQTEMKSQPSSPGHQAPPFVPQFTPSATTKSSALPVHSSTGGASAPIAGTANKLIAEAAARARADANSEATEGALDLKADDWSSVMPDVSKGGTYAPWSSSDPKLDAGGQVYEPYRAQVEQPFQALKKKRTRNKVKAEGGQAMVKAQASSQLTQGQATRSAARIKTKTTVVENSHGGGGGGGGGSGGGGSHEWIQVARAGKTASKGASSSSASFAPSSTTGTRSTTTATLVETRARPFVSVSSEPRVMLRPRETYSTDSLVSNSSNARYFVIKSFSEDDVHKSIKYGMWASTEQGNRRLNQAYVEQARDQAPLYLLFSVNKSGHFCGVAEMTSEVDYATDQHVWASSGKFKGTFTVHWITVKDLPNGALKNIINPWNDNKPVFIARDATELPPQCGRDFLRIFQQHRITQSLFDDFSFYDSREPQIVAGELSDYIPKKKQKGKPSAAAAPASPSSI